MFKKILWVLILVWIIFVLIIEYSSTKKEKLEEEQKQLLQEEEKKIGLNKLEENQNVISNAEKIEQLKQKNKSYIVFNFWKDLFSFKENKDKMELFFNWKNIWNYDKIDKDGIKIFETKGSDIYYYIELLDKKYLYNSQVNILKEIDLKIDVEYVKVSEDQIIFKTIKWSFIHDFATQEFNYYSYFNDFIYYKTWVIWIVKPEEKTRLSNLGFENERQNLIIFYDSVTKEKKILLKTNDDLVKIYLEENKVFLENIKNEKFELENI